MPAPHLNELQVQVLSYWALGIQPPDIAKMLQINVRTIWDMIQKGKDRGYNPAQCMRVKLEYVEYCKRSSRPEEISEATDMAVLASVKQDRNRREKSSEILAFKAGISHSSVLRILHKHGFTIVKPSWKPGLTEAAKAARLRFCLDHQHWTLEDWKAVIFTDETSVILGHRRGSVRVWRTAGDTHDPTCIRRRWKGSSDFLVWGCFTYDKKGPLHIFEPETAYQRKQSEVEIAALNAELEPILREEWEMEMRLKRLHLRGVPGRVPTWRWTEKTGKLVRKSKGGVDWWRYQQVFSNSFILLYWAN
jgi:transposase